MTITDIIAAETHDDGMGDFIVIATRTNAVTEADAIAAVEAAGYTVIREGEGGLYCSYDCDDAPSAIGATEGHAGIAITVAA